MRKFGPVYGQPSWHQRLATCTRFLLKNSFACSCWRSIRFCWRSMLRRICSRMGWNAIQFRYCAENIWEANTLRTNTCAPHLFASLSVRLGERLLGHLAVRSSGDRALKRRTISLKRKSFSWQFYRQFNSNEEPQVDYHLECESVSSHINSRFICTPCRSTPAGASCCVDIWWTISEMTYGLFSLNRWPKLDYIRRRHALNEHRGSTFSPESNLYIHLLENGHLDTLPCEDLENVLWNHT